MGHIRLGELPRTKKWRDVVALIGEGTATPQEMVLAINKVADDRLRALEDDRALSYLYWLLTRVTWLARTKTFLADLQAEGVRLPGQVSGLSFLGQLGEMAARQVRRRCTPSVFSELAVRSFKETVGKAIHDRANTLFGTTLEDVRHAFKEISTPRGFSRVARDFFGGYLVGFFEFVISKESTVHVGWTRGFRDTAALAEFEQSLRAYCHQVTGILEDFSGEWYSKHNWLGDINEQQAQRFVAYAITKIRSELGREVGQE